MISGGSAGRRESGEMRLGVNVPNLGPGTDPAMPQRWARNPRMLADPQAAWAALAAVAGAAG